MRKLVPVFAAAFLFAGVSLIARADEGGKEVTKTGDGVCAKCALKESKTCQNVVQVEEGGKTVKYYLVGDVSKKYHGSSGICTGTVKTKVTGTCKKEGDKLVITASKVEKVD